MKTTVNNQSVDVIILLVIKAHEKTETAHTSTASMKKKTLSFVTIKFVLFFTSFMLPRLAVTSFIQRQLKNSLDLIHTVRLQQSNFRASNFSVLLVLCTVWTWSLKRSFSFQSYGKPDEREKNWQVFHLNCYLNHNPGTAHMCIMSHGITIFIRTIWRPSWWWVSH